MKNSDFIQMTQCNIHSIKFPVDNVKEVFIVNFKLDEHLKIRSMRFTEYADVARQLNGTREAHKHAILTEYLEGQLNALLKIAGATVLEFTGETKLESFV